MGSLMSVEVEDLVELQQPLVRPSPLEPLEEVAHLRLPAGVHLGLLYRLARRLEVVALEVADQDPGVGEEERVVAPAGRGERLAHLWPDRGVPLAILADPVRSQLELKTHPLHRFLRSRVKAPL